MKTQTDVTPELDALLARARATPPVAEPDFMARVLADARALQPAPRPIPARARAPGFARPGFWARMAAALGGALAVAGIGSAAMAGLVIGYVQPDSVVTFAGAIGLGTSESLNLLPGFDALLTEDVLQ